MINKDWHLAHKLPKNANLEARINWHLAHAENCSCRPLGGKILAEIKKRGLQVKL